MEIEFLGTGTSTGVPVIGCQCDTCTSADPHDRRLRASAIIRVKGLSILIDCGPDFREQMLRASDHHIDALLVTHSHYDHVGGIDDIRPYSFDADFPIYCKDDVAHDIRTRLPYCFKEHLYPGVPKLDLRDIKPYNKFSIQGIDVLPMLIWHYKLPILGFRIGHMAYITDAKSIPENTFADLHDIDTLIINALRHKPHMSHMSLSESLDAINRIKPRVAYLTHMSHDIGLHDDIERQLPDNVHLAYDGLTVKCPY